METINLIAVLVCLVLWGWAVGLLLLNQRDPTSTLAWLLYVTMVPAIGPLTFLIFGPLRLERKATRRKQRLDALSTPALEAGGPPLLSHVEENLIRLASQFSDYTVTSGNEVEIFADPAQGLNAMREALRSAKHFIHLEYYIISNDEVTKGLFEDLEAAAKRGVEVRILYDSVGSISLKRFTLRGLERAGVKIAGFLPFSLIPNRINPHFRNHRKILIVDGTVAFTGGGNIGKEYLGRASRKTTWREYLVRVRGPVCPQLQGVFAKDWIFTTNEDLFQPKYFPKPDFPGSMVIQVIESGPDSQFNLFHQILFLAINSAEREVLLTTPYFIPDPAVSSALRVASLRGVKVQLLVPEKSDSLPVMWASRSFYEELLAAGISIHHYQPTVLHAKMLCIDGKLTMCGSANTDIRSFRLNFELNLLMFGEQVASQTSELFRIDQGKSKPILQEAFRNRPVHQKIFENFCRLFSPIL